MTKLILRLFVRNSEKTDDPTVRSTIGKLSGAFGIFSNIILFALKLFVGIITGSIAITADALNNLSDASSSIVMLVGFKLSEKPADSEHPYGHARFEYLSGLVVAAMTLIIGFELAKTSIEKIISPSPVSFTVPAAIILVASVIVKLWMFLFNRKLGKLINSSALMATAIDSRNDAISTSAVILSAIIALLADVQLDSYIGLAVALFILYSGVKLAKETISPLLGENAPPELRQAIIDILKSEEKVLGYHDLMVHDYGPGQRFASLHVEMDYREDPMLCHELIDDLERKCEEELGVKLVIHYDPIVVGDEELDRIKAVVVSILKKEDERISIHDFRSVRGTEHTNLIFDVALPPERFNDKKKIKDSLDAALSECESTKYYTVVTFDMASFN